MDNMNDDAAIRRHGSDLMMALRIEGIVRTMTEIEQGRRPVSALDPIASPMVARRIRLMIREPRRTRPARDAAIRILASSSSRPSVGATEGSVVVRCGERARAYVIRLEQEGDRWRIVELASPDTGLAAASTRAAIEGRLPKDENGIRRSSGPDGAGFYVNTPGGPVLWISPDDPAYQDIAALASERSERMDPVEQDAGTDEAAGGTDEGPRSEHAEDADEIVEEDGPDGPMMD